LLSAHPIGLNPAAGDVSVGLDLQFPLQNKLRIDDIQIHAMARLSHVKVMDVAAGQELDGKAAITGTIVPAYFFNAMPGRLPVVGKLFSPEKGGEASLRRVLDWKNLSRIQSFRSIPLAP
jgi:hypothetical protein